VSHNVCIEALRTRCDAWCETSDLEELLTFAELMKEAAEEAHQQNLAAAADNRARHETDEADAAQESAAADRLLSDGPVIAFGFSGTVASLAAVRLNVDVPHSNTVSSFCSLLREDGCRAAAEPRPFDTAASVVPRGERDARHPRSNGSSQVASFRLKGHKAGEVETNPVEQAAHYFGVKMRKATPLVAPLSLSAMSLPEVGDHNPLQRPRASGPSAAAAALAETVPILQVESTSVSPASIALQPTAVPVAAPRLATFVIQRSFVSIGDSTTHGSPVARANPNSFVALQRVAFPTELARRLFSAAAQAAAPLNGAAWNSFGNFAQSGVLDAPSGPTSGANLLEAVASAATFPIKGAHGQLRRQPVLRTAGKCTVYNPVRLRAARCPLEYPFVWSLVTVDVPAVDESAGRLPSHPPLPVGDSFSSALTKLWLRSDPDSLSVTRFITEMPPAVQATVFSKLPPGTVTEGLMLRIDLDTFKARVLALPPAIPAALRTQLSSSGLSGNSDLQKGSSMGSAVAGADSGGIVLLESSVVGRYEFAWEYANRTSTSWLPLPAAVQRTLSRWLHALRETVTAAARSVDVAASTVSPASPAYNRRLSSIDVVLRLQQAALAIGAATGSALRVQLDVKDLFTIDGTVHFIDLRNYTLTSWNGAICTVRRVRFRTWVLASTAPHAPRPERPAWATSLIRLYEAAEQSDDPVGLFDQASDVRLLIDAVRNGRRASTSRRRMLPTSGAVALFHATEDLNHLGDTDGDSSDDTIDPPANVTASMDPSKRDTNIGQLEKREKQLRDQLRTQQKVLTGGDSQPFLGNSTAKFLNNAPDSILLGRVKAAAASVETPPRVRPPSSPSLLRTPEPSQCHHPPQTLTSPPPSTPSRPQDLMRAVGTPADPKLRAAAALVRLTPDRPSLAVRQILKRGGMEPVAASDPSIEDDTVPWSPPSADAFGFAKHLPVPEYGFGNAGVVSGQQSDRPVSPEHLEHVLLPIRDCRLHEAPPQRFFAGSRSLGGRQVSLGGGARCSPSQGPTPEPDRHARPSTRESEDTGPLQVRAATPVLYAEHLRPQQTPDRTISRTPAPVRSLAHHLLPARSRPLSRAGAVFASTETSTIGSHSPAPMRDRVRDVTVASTALAVAHQSITRGRSPATSIYRSTRSTGVDESQVAASNRTLLRAHGGLQ
jgi:hypothetical protein